MGKERERRLMRGGIELLRIGKSRGQEENSRKARQQAPERIIVCIDENGVIYLCSGEEEC